jgi:2,3-bisphosphoglycerate-independent phosphoglycerate mutase
MLKKNVINFRVNYVNIEEKTKEIYRKLKDRKEKDNSTVFQEEQKLKKENEKVVLEYLNVLYFFY